MIGRAAISGLVLGLLWPATQLTSYPIRALTWQPPASYPLGDAVVVPKISGLNEVWLSGRKMSYLPKQEVWLGIAPQGQVALHFWWQGQNGLELSEIIIKTESLKLDQAGALRLPAAVWKKVNDPKTDERVRDRKILAAIMNDFSGELQTNCWQAPMKSRITSPFGSPRRLPDGYTYYHGGEDRRAMIGTTVKAAGGGRVAFSGEMVVPGNNVIINHGGGWFTRYLHFSKTLTEVDKVVVAGEKIGLSGASGRVEAPHLHWEIVWKGIAADPARFLPAWERLCDPKLASR